MDQATQRDAIYDYLRSGGALTQMEALARFGCMRLGARVWELRHIGVPIRDRWVKRTNAKGEKKRYKEYYIGDGDQSSAIQL